MGVDVFDLLFKTADYTFFMRARDEAGAGSEQGLNSIDQ